MIGDKYECDNQMEISEFIDNVEELRVGGCQHSFLPVRTKRARYCKCVKCGKRINAKKKPGWKEKM